MVAASFIYGELQDQPQPPEPVTVTGFAIRNDQIHVSWAENALPVRIEFTSSLVTPQWSPVAGATALGGTTHSFTRPQGNQGFFRVVVDH